MITTSDGLQYEDALHVLLDQPLNNARNRWVTYHREEGRSEDFVRAWVEAWDSAGPGYGGDTAVAHHRACKATGYVHYPYGAPTSASSAQA